MDTELSKKILDLVEEYSKKYNLDDEKKKLLYEKVKELYERMQIDPGEPVGIVSAQSLSEPTTQMILKSFHFVGVAQAQVSLGLPRIEEILNAKKRVAEKVMIIRLLEPYKYDEKKVYEIAKKIIEVKLERILRYVGMDLYEKKIILELDENNMEFYEIEFKEVLDILKKKFKKYKVEEEGENTITITFQNKSLREIYKIKNSIKNVHIKGVKGIEDAKIRYEDGEYVIYTYGSNLEEVMKIPEVDYTRVYTSDINEIEKVFGIEAAREAIVRELSKIYSSQGLKIDIRHILLVADSLTWYGSYMGITRYGLMSEKMSILSKAAFEIPMKQFIRASLFGIEDDLKSSLDSVITNQIAPIGTGLYHVYFKEK